jgi:2,5-diketo-D-gluconate reductase A
VTTTATSTIALNNGVAMPAIGLGTYPLDDREVAQTVLRATGVGYRLIDTAAKYGNETGVGDGVRACGIPREDLFVTTKLDGGNQGRDRAIPGLDASLRRLRLDYVDLLLIHWPLPWQDLYVDTWRTFEKILATGKTRAIGVSNFKPAHLERLAAGSDLVPAVNQIELNPGVGRVGAREYDAAHGIVTQAWSPLGRGELLSDRVITEIAGRHGRTPAQVIVRWHVQHGVSAVPKSTNEARLAANIGVFDFALSETDMVAIDRLDQGEAAARDSDVEGH